MLVVAAVSTMAVITGMLSLMMVSLVLAGLLVTLLIVPLEPISSPICMRHFIIHEVKMFVGIICKLYALEKLYYA